MSLKVHKIEIFFGLDFEICNISLLVMSKYYDFAKKFLIGSVLEEVRFFRVNYKDNKTKCRLYCNRVYKLESVVLVFSTQFC
jgi:hypothetical protein